MLGVACMDANVVVSLAQLATLNGYSTLVADYSKVSRACATGTNPFLEMENLSCSTKCYEDKSSF